VGWELVVVEVCVCVSVHACVCVCVSWGTLTVDLVVVHDEAEDLLINLIHRVEVRACMDHTHTHTHTHT
jgi:hypothetical protein